jgi:hypothetical protein
MAPRPSARLLAAAWGLACAEALCAAARCRVGAAPSGVIALRAITPLSIGPIVDHRERPRPTAPRARSQRATTPPKKLATHSPLAPFIFVPAMLVANRYAIAGPQNVVRRIETFISNPTAIIIVSTLEPP